MSNNPVYFAFNGSGKSWFCKHNPGWIDVEEEFWILNHAEQLLPMFLCAHARRYDYKVFTNGGPVVLPYILPWFPNGLVLFMPADTPEAKADFLERLRAPDRGTDHSWYEYMKTHFDERYYGVLSQLRPQDKIVWLNAGEHISDYLDESGDFLDEKYAGYAAYSHISKL